MLTDPRSAPILNLLSLRRKTNDRDHVVQAYGYFTDLVNRSLEKEFQLIMPRKQKNFQPSGDFGGYSFFNYHLNADEKKQFNGWLEQQGEDWPLILGTFMASGYKLSVNFLAEDRIWLASSTCNDPELPNHKRVMTSRHPDWVVAAMINAFKHQVIFQGGAWPEQQKQDDWG